MHTEPLIQNISRTKAAKVVKVLVNNRLDAFVQDAPSNPHRAQVCVEQREWPRAMQVLSQVQVRCF
jgi:hypothetical protein